MKQVMCNWSPHCENVYCVHRHPHTPYPSPTKNRNPQCEDNGVFCSFKDRVVNCVPVKELAETKGE